MEREREREREREKERGSLETESCVDCSGLPCYGRMDKRCFIAPPLESRLKGEANQSYHSFLHRNHDLSRPKRVAKQEGARAMCVACRCVLVTQVLVDCLSSIALDLANILA